ncbi:MAG: hypothetical protein HY708_06990 [Ignavibacteriae bacterium]|nr:hypothetical protein [Ignavibacteriota bacterium]
MTDHTNIGYSLPAITASVQDLKEIRRTSVRHGDYLIVKTVNSTYFLRVEEDGKYLASGGWFDRRGTSPMNVRINGCTWGGSIIKADVVAACGLCLEFGNRVTTSPIQEIIVIPAEEQN